MEAPPVLTAERIDAMLSIMAEVCLGSVVEGGERRAAAPDIETFERCDRAVHRACRNLRQTFAMKQRHDREEARKAEDALKAAEQAREAARRSHRDAVWSKRTQVRRHFERVLWDEYEDNDAQEIFEDVDARIGELADADDFLETPLEVLIQRLADEIGPPPPAEDPPEASTETPSEAAAADEPSPPGPAPPEPSPPCGERVGSGGETPAPPQEAQPPDPPPRPPPEPPPEEGYVPPWERLKPGQIFPGGAGW